MYTCGKLKLRQSLREMKMAEKKIECLEEEPVSAQEISASDWEQMDDRDARQPSKTSRPLLLKLLALLYLLLSWFGWIRMAGALADWQLLNEFLSETMLVYIAAGGAVWGLGGLVSAVSLWFGMSIASWFSRAFAVVCFAWYWLDQLFLTRSSLAETERLFEVIASLLLLAFAILVPALPRVKRFLDKSG